MSEIFRRGDIVQNFYGASSTKGCPLTCGSGYYNDAIVVQPEPFVLVSREGDMLWSCLTAEDQRYLKVIGFATPDEAREAFNRFRRYLGEDEDTGDKNVDLFDSNKTNFGRVEGVKKSVPADIMVKVDGKIFRCDCGCNVFHHPLNELQVYECNSCEAWYRGVSKEIQNG